MPFMKNGVKKINESLINSGSLITFKKNINNIVKDFDNLPIHEDMVKPKVGIVGEILVKYHPVANNNVVEF